MKTIKRRKVSEPRMTGVLVKLINPENGADIVCPNFAGKKFFKLRKNSSKILDKAWANAALFNWAFLTTKPLKKDETPEAEDVTEEDDIEAPDDDSEDDEDSEEVELVDGEDAFAERKIDYAQYDYITTRKIAGILEIENYAQLKKEVLFEAVAAADADDVLHIIKDLKLPEYFVN